MLGLSKALIPLFFMTLVSLICSYFGNFAWLFPLICIPFYWLPIDPYELDRSIRYNTGVSRETSKMLNIKEPDIYHGKPFRCVGIFNPYIATKQETGYGVAIVHELCHIHFKHPFLNSLYFTLCTIAISLCLFLMPFMVVVFALTLIPLTNFKTLKMEIWTDVLADTFVDMEKYVRTKTHDSWFRTKRLAALSGKRT